MPEKILYYFGAGGSVQALPLAKTVWGNINTTPAIPKIPGLPYELDNFCSDPILTEYNEDDIKNMLDHISVKSKELSEQALKFGDVDTYAKSLHIMNPGGSKLQELKQTLSQYFSIKQIILNAVDSRYLPWLVSIMERPVFPENVKILSWNYDFQIEIAATMLGGQHESINHTSSTGFVYSPSSLCYYLNLDPAFNDFSRLSLIHLNGIAGYATDSRGHTCSVFQQGNMGIDPQSCMKFLTSNDLHKLLHFAWENSVYHKSLMQHVKNMIYDTTIVVVIGYSFPFFNRQIDKEIFDILKANKIFRKIYYQDPVLNGQHLRAQFDIPPHIDIQHINKVDNFYVPFEY